MKQLWSASREETSTFLEDPPLTIVYELNLHYIIDASFSNK